MMMTLRLCKLKLRRIHLKQAILYLLVVVGFAAFVFTSSSTFYDEGGGGGGGGGRAVDVAGGSSGSGSSGSSSAFAAAAGGSSLILLTGNNNNGLIDASSNSNNKQQGGRDSNNNLLLAAHPARREPASADYMVGSSNNNGLDRNDNHDDDADDEAAVVFVDMGTVEVVKSNNDAEVMKAGGGRRGGGGGAALQVTSEKGQTVRALTTSFGKQGSTSSRSLVPSSGDGSQPRQSAVSSWWANVLPHGAKPWFFANGSFCADPSLVNSEESGRLLPLWPDEDSGDRIIEQLMYSPPVSNTAAGQTNSSSSSLRDVGENADPSIISIKTVASDADGEDEVIVQEVHGGHLHVVHKASSSSSSHHQQHPSRNSMDNKMILLYQHGWPHAKPGKESFAECPVKNCAFTKSKHDMRDADAVLFKDFVPAVPRPNPHQVWVLYLLESPMHTQGFVNVRSINWTATYRRDSDIVTPYAKWVYYDPAVTSVPVTRNFAANKTKMVAWFVSNCHARNNRLQYVRELAKHVGVDVYGACGNYKCPKNNAQMCFDLLNARYKFYLAFENSNCVDYITEKLFLNGLGNDVVPIVMGARPEDYARMAPAHSYIHVDDFPSPAALAEHLRRLDADDALYNEYFAWRGSGEFINTFFFCRLCAALHDPARPANKEYVNLSKWWRLDAMCRRGSWRTDNNNNNNNNSNNIGSVSAHAGPPYLSSGKYDKAKAAYAAKKRQQLLLGAGGARAGNSVDDDYAAASKNDVMNSESRKRRRRSLGADDIVRNPKGDKWPVLL